MTHPSLARLGLTVDADERAIRRAYARELKLIDQDADPAGFQALREAYEMASAWAQHRARMAAQASLAVAMELEHGPQDDSGLPAAAVHAVGQTGQVAAHATDGRMERIAPLPGAASPGPGQPQASREDGEGALALLEDEHPSDTMQARVEEDVAAPTPSSISVEVMCELLAALKPNARREPRMAQQAWKAALLGALNDERLVPLDVRQYFEYVVLEYLNSAWQDSHPDVLHAAAQVFEWETDRARLRVFGTFGELADMALQQRHVLDSMHKAEADLQAQALAYLRAGQLPERKQLAVLYPCLYRMRAQAPEYVRLVVDPEVAARWQAAYEQFGLRDPATVPPPADKAAASAGSSDAGHSLRWMLIFCFFMALKFGLSALIGKDRPPSPPPAVMEAGPTAEEIRDIQSRIQYQPRFQGKKEVELISEYLVHINSIGKVAPAYLTKSSGDPDFDAAVEKALLDARPFPYTTKRQFSIQIGMRYSWEAQEAAVQAPRQAAPVPAPAVSQLSDDELDEIRKRIFFTYHGDDDIGTAAYRVKLDAEGHIVSLDKAKASAQPGFDEAVKNAIVSMEPFASGRGTAFRVAFTRRPKTPAPSVAGENKAAETVQPSDSAPGDLP
jgi:outer membrane biosynthesis protein TonB